CRYPPPEGGVAEQPRRERARAWERLLDHRRAQPPAFLDQPSTRRAHHRRLPLPDRRMAQQPRQACLRAGTMSPVLNEQYRARFSHCPESFPELHYLGISIQLRGPFASHGARNFLSRVADIARLDRLSISRVLHCITACK